MLALVMAGAFVFTFGLARALANQVVRKAERRVDSIRRYRT